MQKRVKVTDFLADFLSDRGLTHVFGVTGGAVVHIFDSLAWKPGIEIVFPHHEQCAAFAAVAYAKMRGMGVAVVTTGPGGTNALTGLLAAWQDSVPCLFISGQQVRAQMSRGTGLRQRGTQEFDIISLVQSMTKFACAIETPEQFVECLPKAWNIALSGRPGPVWLDLPLDLQFQLVDICHSPENSGMGLESPALATVQDLEIAQEMLTSARRPLCWLGHGVTLSKAAATARQLIESLELPFVATWTAGDIIPSGHKLCVGRPGTVGQRGANLAVQNCDLLLVLGSRLNQPVTGGNFAAFARAAKIISVNIDRLELERSSIKLALPVVSDAAYFCKSLLDRRLPKPVISSWHDKCSRYAELNKIPAERYRTAGCVDPYVFMEALCSMLTEETLVVDGGGTGMYASMQGLETHERQRLLLSGAIGAMGSGLPEAIGACAAAGRKTTICTVGDGSMQLNVQELQTLLTYKLPVKVFILNNRGYLAIRHTQDVFLEKRHVGSNSRGGIETPDFCRVAEAYGVPAFRISAHQDMRETLRRVLEREGPVVCEIMTDPNGRLLFSQGFDRLPDGRWLARPLEDMEPFLPREEFSKLMEIEHWQGK